MSISPRQVERVRQAVILDANVSLAVVFGPTNSDRALSLLLDCEDSAARAVQALVKRIQMHVGAPLRAYRLADARSAAILMLQALQQGQVVKDFYGQWDRLWEETDVIEEEAEQQKQFSADLQTEIGKSLEADDAVTLAVAFAPVGVRDLRTELDLLISRRDEDEKQLIDLQRRLQLTSFKPSILPLNKALDFPFALSHILRSGLLLKDSAGQWQDLQSKRTAIIRAGLRQQAGVQLARSWAGGRNGTASLN